MSRSVSVKQHILMQVFSQITELNSQVYFVFWCISVSVCEETNMKIILFLFRFRKNICM